MARANPVSACVLSLGAAGRWRAARFGAVSLLAFAGSSSQPLRAAEPLQKYGWTGFYLGGDFGYGSGSFGRDTHPRPLQAVVFPASVTGFIGGYQAGYNFQTGNNLVPGIETDISFGSPQRMPVPQQPPFDTSFDLVGTTRARLGYAAGRWLPFVTGGLAWGKMKVTQYDPDNQPTSPKVANNWGWTAGLGVEYALTGRWTAKLEYDYLSLNARSYELQPPAPTSLQVEPHFHLVKLGLNYRLSNPSPGARAAAAPSSPGWSIHGQTTFIDQGYGRIRSPYQGPNSLPAAGQVRETWTSTLFVGRKLWEGGEVFINPELGQGGGFAGTLGLAGFSNGEAQKAGAPYPRVRAQRYFFRQTFGFGGEQEKIEDEANEIAGKRDINRLTFTVGRFAVGDFFDDNSYAHDPRVDFQNWAIWSSAAYDFPADLPGYTRGAVAELNRKDWAVRAGVFQVPLAPNSDVLRFDSGAAAAEFEGRYTMFDQPGKIRIGAFTNRGHMASYRGVLAATASTGGDIVFITNDTRATRSKSGLYANVEQAVAKDVGMFGRASWNDGNNEILSFTDIDRSVSGGVSIKGSRWGRTGDTFGLAGAVNGLSRAHRDFLSAGGLGLLIGDGALNYRNEQIMETYYSFGVTNGIALTFDYQFIANPAYNADRGPVSIFTGRLHAEF
jgi:high affinity Mn2+ porin